MKYILIVGKGYRDCKAKFEAIKKMPETKYPFITKVKHLIALEDNEYVLTEVAKENPNFDEIMKVVTRKETKPDIETINEEWKEDGWEVIEPVVEEEATTDIPIEEEKVDDFDAKYKEKRDKRWDEIVESLKEKEVEIVEEVIEEEPVVEELIIPEVEDEPEPEIFEPEIIVEVIEEEPVMKEVIDDFFNFEPEPEISEPEMEEPPLEVKPVNAPRGWHARKEFIDEIGNVFNKGKYSGINVNDA